MDINKIVEEVYLDLLKSPLKDRVDFVSCNQENLISYHFTLGRNIRNKYKLWTTNSYMPKIINDIDLNPNHPEAISQHIIQLVWERAQNK